MKPTLNQEDIKILRSIFATKDDLVAMEKRQDQKYATKGSLISLEEELKKHVTGEVEKLQIFMKKYFEDIKLEDRLNNHGKRIKAIEDVTPALSF